MEHRTMRGKLVVSYKMPGRDFAVWPENHGYVVVAPSGARMSPHRDLASADEARDLKQREWDELQRAG
jgi:hypothetical protein